MFPWWKNYHSTGKHPNGHTFNRQHANISNFFFLSSPLVFYSPRPLMLLPNVHVFCNEVRTTCLYLLKMNRNLFVWIYWIYMLNICIWLKTMYLILMMLEQSFGQSFLSYIFSRKAYICCPVGQKFPKRPNIIHNCTPSFFFFLLTRESCSFNINF